ncbi:MAG: ATPase domain-containing protein [Candidatus Thermoplasmatota archaeon]
MIEGRVRTYIDGFDERLQGGIPEGSIVLVVGEPGTMKSSVAYNILHHNALHDGRKCLYITLEQSSSSLKKHMRGLGWEMEAVKDRMEVVDIGLIRKRLTQLKEQSWMQVFKMYAKSLHETSNYELLSVDSLPVLQLLAKFKEPREEMFHLFEWLRDLGVTTLLVSEMCPDSRSYARYEEDFLADGIIYLRMMEMGGVSVQRHVRCVKMRATNHSTDYFSLLFDSGRLKATRVISNGAR